MLQIKHQICFSFSPVLRIKFSKPRPSRLCNLLVETHVIGPSGPVEVLISQHASVGWSHHRSAADSPPDGPDGPDSLRWIHSAPCIWSSLDFKMLTVPGRAGPGRAAAGGIPSSHESFSSLVFANRCTPKNTNHHRCCCCFLLGFFDQSSFNKSSWLDANVTLCMWKAEATEGLVLIRPKLINGRLKLPPEVREL